MIIVYLQYLLLITKECILLSFRPSPLFPCDIIIILKTKRHNYDAEDEKATDVVLQSILRHFSELIVLTTATVLTSSLELATLEMNFCNGATLTP